MPRRYAMRVKSEKRRTRNPSKRVCIGPPEVKCTAMLKVLALPETLLEIFGHFDAQTLGRGAQVSRLWRDLIKERHLWSRVTVGLTCLKDDPHHYQIAPVKPQYYSNNIHPSTAAQPIGREFPLITKLVVCHECCPSDRTAQLIVQRFKNLVWLKLSFLSSYQVSDLSLTHIAGGSKLLRHLDVGGCLNITDRGVATLCGFNGTSCDGNVPALLSLSLHGVCMVTDEALRFLSVGQPALQNLNLMDCGLITNRGLLFLSRLVDLRALNLRSVNKICDEGINHLTQLANLRNLHISSTLMTSDGLDLLAAGDSQLTNLSLASCWQVNNNWRHSLCRFSQLATLELLDTKIGDVVLKCLADGAGASTIDTLDLRGCRTLTNKAGRHLARMKNLRVLNINHTPIGDAGLGYLAAAKESRIEELSILKNESLTGVGLNHVARLPRLRQLNVCECSFFTQWGLANPKIVMGPSQGLCQDCCRGRPVITGFWLQHP